MHTTSQFENPTPVNQTSFVGDADMAVKDKLVKNKSRKSTQYHVFPTNYTTTVYVHTYGLSQTIINEHARLMDTFRTPWVNSLR